jgi:preprotein translocase subunit YajC
MKKFLLSLIPVFAVSSLFAADAAAPAKGQNMYQTFIMIGIALLFFYFILWRPEKKRRKKMEDQRGKMAKGDKVTAMGILGIVDKITEKTVILKMIDGAKIEVLKGAITEVAPASAGETVEASS